MQIKILLLRLKQIASIFIIYSSLLLTSCELQTHSNGDLDGYWQLNSIDSLEQHKSVDMTSSRIFWAFQAKLLKTSDITGKNSTILLRFNHQGDSLKLYDPVLPKPSLTDPSGDQPLTDPSLLRPYGIHSLNEGYKVLYLSDERMTLQNNSLRLNFVKF